MSAFNRHISLIQQSWMKKTLQTLYNLKDLFEFKG